MFFFDLTEQPGVWGQPVICGVSLMLQISVVQWIDIGFNVKSLTFWAFPSPVIGAKSSQMDAVFHSMILSPFCSRTSSKRPVSFMTIVTDHPGKEAMREKPNVTFASKSLWMTFARIIMLAWLPQLFIMWLWKVWVEAHLISCRNKFPMELFAAKSSNTILHDTLYI